MTQGRRTETQLIAAGFDLSLLSDEQREVLLELTEEEFELLADIKSRMDEAAPEVQAHGELAGATLF
ncbi:hypothetical protein KDL01_37435 [Actinospica durhamensis]|uniref:Uncharacterized protein n=1 Tax=Actinospica durhamensis TaxID=1508375 RepID=A0A941IRN9_9ACTN|nr:aroma-sacti cluster domain-containing protein [Actinospica durhamensis]MBR7839010.1 hypothetical protein [Actinospica durhamensis]